MPRKPRINLPGVTQHIVQRGNNKARCFIDNNDFAAYLNWLASASEEHDAAIHAWVLMTNHVHLLVTPQQETSVSKMMQSLGRRYVAYFNNKYSRTGTLWEGRFKSCLVDSVGYVLACYRYIELNPVRANIVACPEDYLWSSYQSNAVGKKINMCTAHAVYLALGKDKTDRLNNYQKLFSTSNDKRKYDDIRASTSTGLPVGSADFLNDVEDKCQISIRPSRPGRPRKKIAV